MRFSAKMQAKGPRQGPFFSIEFGIFYASAGIFTSAFLKSSRVRFGHVK